ncbi:hypothetical protein DVS77_34070 [Mycolicibacterium moriokaense]|nr:hypothetical protein DVS77_34070 [Mycolicibacterium moriokaense]
MQQTIDIEPQPRIDTLVRLPGGGEARRTEYVGTVWFDGKPEIAGLTLRRPSTAPRGIRVANFESSFFVPDSLQYTRAALGDATLSLSVLLRAAADTGAIVDAAAVFTDDPTGAPVTWIQVHVRGHLGWPAAIGYRIVALTPPDAAP